MPVDLQEGVAEVQALIAGIVGELGGGQRLRGRSWFFKLAAGSPAVPWRVDQDIILTGVVCQGLNVVVSISGVAFSFITSQANYSDGAVIYLTNNQAADYKGYVAMNVNLPMAQNPDLKLYVENNGSGVSYVSFFYDVVIST